MTIEGTVMDILGYPDLPFNKDARIPARKAPKNAQTAGGREKISMNSKRIVFEIAPMIPADMASGIGLLNIMENPNTPKKLLNRRRKIHCHNAR